MANNNINLNFINNRHIFRPQNLPNQQNAPQMPQIQEAAQQKVFQTPEQIASQQVQTAMMGGAENAAFIRDVMKLPANFNAFIYILQQKMSAAQLSAQLHKYLMNMNGLTQTQAQILAQLKGINGAALLGSQGINQQILAQLEGAIKRLPISANGMINISDITALLTANGKDAITQLIISMANSAKSGLNNINQLKDAARLINASVAIASQGDNAQTLKMLMLLYLPWLPLQEGVDFDLEFTSSNENNPDESVLVIRIQTRNYGEVVAVLTLETSNSVDINIQAVEDFPKDEIILGLNSEKYSVNQNLSFSTKTSDTFVVEKTKATINMSQTNEINPYLLLTAHQIIRLVVEIDNRNP